MTFRADLHCHTTCSDGSVTPDKIIELALTKGLNGLSITDHDTIEAYGTALPVANSLGLQIVSGIELSAVHKHVSVHILGYSFSVESEIIKDFCIKHTRRRENRNRQILDLLKKHGMEVTEEEIQPVSLTEKHTIGRPHIALAMMRRGYVTSIQEAFHKYIGEGRPCYSPGGYFSVEETIDLIHRARGFAIIAHPHLIDDSSLVKDLLDMPFDGIEGYYSRFQLHHNEKWIQIGIKKGWLITGGSDFHGDIKPNIALGSSWVGEEVFSVLRERFEGNS